MRILGNLGNIIGHFLSGNPDSVDTPSPAVLQWTAEMELVRDLFEGWHALVRRAENYLPQHPSEKPESYKTRVARPTFYNSFARTVRGLAGVVFNELPESVGVPQQIQELLDDDIDAAGTDAMSFLNHAFTDALVTGHSVLLVDAPAAPEGLTKLQEQELGIRPFWTFYAKDDVRSFLTRVENGHKVLQQIVLREWVQRQVGRYGVKIVEQFRVLRNVGGTVEFEIWERKDGLMQVDAGIVRGVQEIPVAVIYTGRTDYHESRPPLIDLATLNLLHYQTWSDMAHASHIASVPVLFGKGMREESIVIGPHHAILTDDPQADLKWLETTGASIESSRMILQDVRADMTSLGLSVLERKRAAETATAKTLESKEKTSPLSTIVNDLEDGIEQALSFTAQFLGLGDDGGSLKFTRNFEITPAAEGRERRETQPDEDPVTRQSVGADGV